MTLQEVNYSHSEYQRCRSDPAPDAFPWPYTIYPKNTSKRHDRDNSALDYLRFPWGSQENWFSDCFMVPEWHEAGSPCSFCLQEYVIDSCRLLHFHMQPQGQGSFKSIPKVHLFSQTLVMEIEKYSNKDSGRIFLLGYGEFGKASPIF